MKRRTLLASAAGLLAPRTGPFAQSEKPYRIAYFHDDPDYVYPGTPPAPDRDIRRRDQVERWAAALDRTTFREHERLTVALREGLRQFFAISQPDLFTWAHAQIEVFFAASDLLRAGNLQLIAKRLIDEPVDVLVTAATPVATAITQMTAAIPVVVTSCVDPIGAGFATGQFNPRSNVTGICTDLTPITEQNRIKLLKTLLPSAQRLALLWPRNPLAETDRTRIEDAAKTAGLTLRTVVVADDDQLEAICATLAADGSDAILVPPHPMFSAARERVLQLMARYLLAACYPAREFVEAGGLLSYGSNILGRLRQAGVQAGKLLIGTPLAEIPFEQPGQLELTINLKTAKALGITIPISLFAHIDDVIE